MDGVIVDVDLGAKSLKRTMLYDYHQAHARLMEFAGYEMPSEYRGVIHEHLSVRNSVGVFDVSHMARFLLEGKDAGRLLDRVASKACSPLERLKAQYVLFCNPDGGIIDDLIIYRLSDERYMTVVNAGNRTKDLAWLNSHAAGYNVRLEDVTDRVPMFAVQGPNATHVLQEAVGEKLEDIPRFGFRLKDHESVKLLISRTGYTGEDGFEIIALGEFGVSPYAHRLWETLVNAAAKHGGEACGLLARDTLRIEAGLCLYGWDIDESTSPVEARLNFALDFDHDFIGKPAIIKQRESGPTRTRVGIKMTEAGIPRHGMSILSTEGKVGVITSGTYSPLLKTGVGMGYVTKEKSTPGTKLRVEIRGKSADCEVAKFPLYDATGYGWKRKQTARE